MRLMPIDGKDYLFYKAFPISVGIIRVTTADADGNLTMEREAPDAGGAGDSDGRTQFRRW